MVNSHYWFSVQINHLLGDNVTQGKQCGLLSRMNEYISVMSHERHDVQIAATRLFVRQFVLANSIVAPHYVSFRGVPAGRLLFISNYIRKSTVRCDYLSMHYISSWDDVLMYLDHYCLNSVSVVECRGCTNIFLVVSSFGQYSKLMFTWSKFYMKSFKQLLWRYAIRIITIRYVQ